MDFFVICKKHFSQWMEYMCILYNMFKCDIDVIPLQIKREVLTLQ